MSTRITYLPWVWQKVKNSRLYTFVGSIPSCNIIPKLSKINNKEVLDYNLFTLQQEIFIHSTMSGMQDEITF